MSMTTLDLERTMRYVRHHGSLDGERDAAEAKRLGMPCDDWPHAEYRDQRIRTHAWNVGVNVGVLDVNHRVDIENAYVGGYRPAYLHEFYDGEVW